MQLSEEVEAEGVTLLVMLMKRGGIINGLGCRKYKPTQRDNLGYSLACCHGEERFYLFECCYRAVGYLFVADE